MKRVLLTTTAIVGLSAPAFAADPTAVSDQPYFHHSHPMTWSGAMSISLTNPSGSDVDAAIVKAGKRDWMFDQLSSIASVKVWPSEANFILIRLKQKSGPDIFGQLKDKGFLVKNLTGAHPLLMNCLRVTIGTREENKEFLTALRELIL